MNIQNYNFAHINRNQQNLAQALNGVSSGLRINRAADDAAGLAVASRFSSEHTSLLQASRNINDGIGMLQTIEDTLESHGNIAMRMRELLVQANNETYTSNDRGQIRIELVELRREYERISQEAEFNGLGIMGDNPTTISIQIGHFNNSDNRIDIDLSTLYSFRDITDNLTILRGRNGIGFVNPNSGVELLNDHSSYNRNGFANKIGIGLTEVDTLYTSITQRQAIVGALQNRMESALNTNRSYENNLLASSSSIVDADYAHFSSSVVRHQVRMDASVSSLAQARGLSKNILALL